MRLSESEFWALDPVSFSALMQRHNEAIKTAFMPVAILTSTYINAHLPEHAPRVSPSDFIPGEAREKTVSPEAESAIWRQWAEAHNRTVK